MVRKLVGKLTGKRAAVKKKVVAAPAQAPVRQAVDVPAAAPEVSVAVLIEQLRRGDLASRSLAAVKLGTLAHTQAISALTEALRDPTAEVAREAAFALGVFRDSAVTHALIAVVLNRDGYYHSTVRSAAAESLGALGDVVAFDALAAAVRDAYVGPSIAAIRALARVGGVRAIPLLEPVASNADGFFLDEARAAAVTALRTLVA